MQALARVAGQELAPLELARWANRVEVEHFGAPRSHGSRRERLGRVR